MSQSVRLYCTFFLFSSLVEKLLQLFNEGIT